MRTVLRLSQTSVSKTTRSRNRSASPSHLHVAASVPSDGRSGRLSIGRTGSHQSGRLGLLPWNRFCHPDFHHRARAVGPSSSRGRRALGRAGRRALNADLAENYEPAPACVRLKKARRRRWRPATKAPIRPRIEQEHGRETTQLAQSSLCALALGAPHCGYDETMESSGVFYPRHMLLKIFRRRNGEKKTMCRRTKGNLRSHSHGDKQCRHDSNKLAHT